MAEFSSHNRVDLIAISPDLAKNRTELSNNNGNDDAAHKAMSKQMRISGEQVLARAFDSTSSLCLNDEKEKGTDNIFETHILGNLRSPSNFAQQIGDGLRAGHSIDELTAKATKNVLLNNDNQVAKVIADKAVENRTSNQPVKPTLPPDKEMAILSQQLPQPHRTIHLDFSHLQKPVAANKDKHAKSSKHVDNGEKHPDFSTWKERYKGKMSDYEIKFTWLVNDIRQHPEKYPELVHGRKHALPALTVSTKLNSEAKDNSIKINRAHYSDHLAHGGYEIAFYTPGNPKSALAGFMNSKGHRDLIQRNYGKNGKFGVSRVGNGLTMRFS